jgi:class 3 adenylate cyclase
MTTTTRPTGTVTLLFTDIGGSTQLLRNLGERYADTLAEHRRLLRKSFERNNGARSTLRATLSLSPSRIPATPRRTRRGEE